MREYQVRFCERLGVKLPGPTRQIRTNPGYTLSASGRSAIREKSLQHNKFSLIRRSDAPLL